MPGALHTTCTQHGRGVCGGTQLGIGLEHRPSPASLSPSSSAHRDTGICQHSPLTCLPPPLSPPTHTVKPGALNTRVLPMARMSQKVSVLSLEATRSSQSLVVEARAQIACEGGKGGNHWGWRPGHRLPARGGRCSWLT